MNRPYNLMRTGRESSRLKNWDYSRKGFYFVTICTKDREELFGEIDRREMVLNGYGKTVREIICGLSSNFDMFLDCFVVMPNHVHFVVFLRGGAIHESPVQKRSELSKLVGYLKMNVSKKIHLLGYKGEIWQRNYYDRVVRNGRELEKIRRYIINNPGMWYRDRNNLEIER